MENIISPTPPVDDAHFEVHEGPPGRWPGGNLIDFNRDPLSFLRGCANYGEIVRLHFGGYPIFFLNHPKAIEGVLVTHNGGFIKGRGLGRTRDLLGNGLLTSEGEFWRRQRRLAQPAFHSTRITAYADIMRGRTDQMLAGWRDGATLDVHQAMMDLTMGIAGQALFSTDLTGEASAVSRSMGVLLKDFSQRNQRFFVPEWLPTLSKWRRERAIEVLDEVVFRMIGERRKASDAGRSGPGDLLDMLLEARDETGAGMTDKQLRDEVMTLFLAGHETTANALAWTWRLLGLHPEVEAKLVEEIERSLGDRPPTAEDLPGLPYASHIITEAMRLYPPAWIIGRQAVEDVALGGVVFPAGAGVIMSQWVMHRDRRYYDDPEQFKPERWAGGLMRRMPHFAYFPFGGGPRMCIGRPFALMEARLVLVRVAQCYHLELLPNQSIRPFPSVTLRPGNAIKVKLVSRTRL